MKRSMGILLALLVVGSTLYGAFSFTPVLGSSSGNEAYDEFWSILNKEAYLVYEFNKSLALMSPNRTIGSELIINSRRGELNAANISAQVWIVLEELKKSGVKLHYTAEELREMARNISQHGLPNETVKELKSQGWTDEEIRALEEYIARNSQNITSGFDMESFLVNFSRAFVEVGFKYVNYETWAFEKMNWFNPSSVPTDGYKNWERQIVPPLQDEWSKFYGSYLKGNVNGMLLQLLTLINGAEKVISNSTKVEGGGVVKTLYIKRTPVLSGLKTTAQSSSSSDKSIYYWPGALSAYRTMREIYVLLEAMKLGNKNPELKAMLNQKVAKLKDDLVAYVSSVNVDPSPSPNPPNPSPLPIPCSTGKCYLSSGSPAAETLEASTKNPALNVNDNYGYIDGLQVTLEKSLRSDGHLEYRIRIVFSVERNQISNVNITLTTPQGTDSVHYSTLTTGQHEWESKTFISSGTITSPGDTVVIDGNVKITYVSTDSPTPNSAPISTYSIPASGPREQEVTKSFHFRVTYDDLVQASNVHAHLILQPSSVSAGDQVTFRLSVENYNNVSIHGHWRAGIEIPDENGVVWTKHCSGNLTIGASSSSTVTIATVSYPKAGDYRYWVTFSFGDDDNSKTINGTLHVSGSSGGSTGYRLWIEGVTPEPAYPKEGDTVKFNVRIDSSYRDTQKALVKLYVDNKLKDSKPLNVSVSGVSVTLQWLAQAGEHKWRVELWRIGISESATGSLKSDNLLSANGGVLSTGGKDDSVLEDTDNGVVCVGDYPYVGNLKISPSVIHPNQEVNFTVTLENRRYHGSNGITIFVKDEQGNILFSDYFSFFDEINQQKTKTYHPMISSIGTHKYTLYVKTYPEYSLNTASLSVRSSGSFLEQVSFSCTNMYFNYHWSHLIYEAPLSCTATVRNPTNKRIIIDSVEIVNMSFPFDSDWTIEHPSRLDKNSTGNIVFKTTVTAGESKVLLWWRVEVWIDLIYQISGLPEDADEGTIMTYHARYTKIHVSADKKDVVADSFINLIGICSEYYETKGLLTIISQGSKDLKDTLAVLNGIVQFGKWVLGKLQGG
ncbi:COG1470 family protein [Thermococcus sp.]